MSNAEGKAIACKCCNRLVYVPPKTLGITCRKCNTYNDSEYVENAEEYPYENADPSAPALVRVDEAKLNYTKFRDEHAIRADLFVNGKTRASLGPARFKKMLKNELMKNKCYRGDASNV